MPLGVFDQRNSLVTFAMVKAHAPQPDLSSTQAVSRGGTSSLEATAATSPFAMVKAQGPRPDLSST